ncbi:MAG TPA: alpha-1,4-glucan--maltose-1-phosphate maltosyltransferase [Thermoanaerobaculia bacterium]|nr:alpha-1,4-glucan--maltose-1-phosphate maltosyltransferase [Thermoanaerobaculia bacterium]
MRRLQEVDGRHRVIIEGVRPRVDDGRFPAKRVIGDDVVVEADIFADGHDVIAASLLFRHSSSSEWSELRMAPLPNDRWRAAFRVEELGFHLFTIEGWIDHFLTWHRDLRKRAEAKQSDLDVQLVIGLEMIRAAAARASGREKRKLESYVRTLEGDDPIEEKIEEMWSGDLLALMARHGERRFVTRYEQELAIEVDRRRAAFSTWYEMFPRSASARPGAHGTLRDVIDHLPRIAKMGFDVLYLPPIHPIGTTFRKGRNNRLAAEDGDAGSPWAVGAPEGGHKSVHPQLGTIDDVERLVAAAREHGIDLALDIAFQASPDHPYVQEHEVWFSRRPDGSIQYAENPPKKYQDIYPFDFESDAWRELWEELRDIFRFWMEKGVRIFRVDNPHTKALPFWEWCIRELKRDNPDVIFLAEAFTRPKIMYWLAKAGFSQSYTYFAWRNTAHELRTYFSEITRPPVSDFFRPNAWPNTPDILTEYLQYGGRPAFVIRLILAATLSSNYGIYGPAFERMVHTPREQGSEEYLDSEKYEVKHWGTSDDDLSDLIALVNRIRRENPALQQNVTLRFHPTTNDQLLCYSKSCGENVIVTVVSVDPYNAQSGWVELDSGPLGIGAGHSFQAHDLLTGARHSWSSGRNHVQLDPHVVPAHIFRIRRKVRTERDFEYYL